MGRLRWYKRNADSALAGMMGLSLEERGAYNTVLDLMYARAPLPLPDDERFICGWLRCDVRVWRRIRKRLLDLEKLQAVDGVLTNDRARCEIDRALSIVNLRVEAGRKSRSVHKENKRLVEADSHRIKNQNQKEKKESHEACDEGAGAAVNGKAESDGAILFRVGLLSIVSRGYSESTAKQVIGRWLKAGNSAPAILAALRTADSQTGVVNFVGYVSEILKKAPARFDSEAFAARMRDLDEIDRQKGVPWPART